MESFAEVIKTPRFAIFSVQKSESTFNGVEDIDEQNVTSHNRTKIRVMDTENHFVDINENPIVITSDLLLPAVTSFLHLNRTNIATTATQNGASVSNDVQATARTTRNDVDESKTMLSEPDIDVANEAPSLVSTKENNGDNSKTITSEQDFDAANEAPPFEATTINDVDKSETVASEPKSGTNIPRDRDLYVDAHEGPALTQKTINDVDAMKPPTIELPRRQDLDTVANLGPPSEITTTNENDVPALEARKTSESADSLPTEERDLTIGVNEILPSETTSGNEIPAGVITTTNEDEVAHSRTTATNDSDKSKPITSESTSVQRDSDIVANEAPASAAETTNHGEGSASETMTNDVDDSKPTTSESNSFSNLSVERDTDVIANEIQASAKAPENENDVPDSARAMTNDINNSETITSESASLSKLSVEREEDAVVNEFHASAIAPEKENEVPALEASTTGVDDNKRIKESTSVSNLSVERVSDVVANEFPVSETTTPNENEVPASTAISTNDVNDNKPIASESASVSILPEQRELEVVVNGASATTTTTTADRFPASMETTNYRDDSKPIISESISDSNQLVQRDPDNEVPASDATMATIIDDGKSLTSGSNAVSNPPVEQELDLAPVEQGLDLDTNEVPGLEVTTTIINEVPYSATITTKNDDEISRPLTSESTLVSDVLAAPPSANLDESPSLNEKTESDQAKPDAILAQEASKEPQFEAKSAAPTNETNSNIFIVLLSTMSLKREIGILQDKAIGILKTNKVKFVTIDGADQGNKDSRSILFDISGLRGQYPQFFISTAGNNINKETTSFWGDWDKFEFCNENGTLGQELSACTESDANGNSTNSPAETSAAIAVATPVPTKEATLVATNGATSVSTKDATPVPTKAATSLPTKEATPVAIKAVTPFPSKLETPAANKSTFPVATKTAYTVPTKASYPVATKAPSPSASNPSNTVATKVPSPVFNKPVTPVATKVPSPVVIKPVTPAATIPATPAARLPTSSSFRRQTTKNVLMLYSNQSLSKETAQQNKARMVLNSLFIKYQSLDGSDAANKERCDELFTFSGKRDMYPQFFIIDKTTNTTTFWGTWEEFESSHDGGSLKQDLFR